MIKNSGNRPATDIELKARSEEILECVFANLREDNKYLNEILHLCSGKSKNPLLANDEECTVDFYYSTRNWAVNDMSLWRQGSSFSLKIIYSDLDQNKYRSIINVFIE